MKRSFSVYGITSIIFLLMGLMFTGFAFLVNEGMMTATSSIDVGPDIVFGITGTVLIVSGLIFLFVEVRKNRIYNKIINQGDYIKVKVLKVKHEKNIRVNRRSPYVIYVTHSDLPADKKMKSFFLWERPYIAEGDRIKVLYHPNYPYNFVVEEFRV